MNNKHVKNYFFPGFYNQLKHVFHLLMIKSDDNFGGANHGNQNN